jgi:glycosyltransferase involved in cell wall biosynthesis
MKLVFLLETFTGGGVERNTLVLTTLLADRGHDVRLVVCQNKGPLKDRVDQEKVSLKILDPEKAWRGRLLALKADRDASREMLLPVLLARQPPKPIQYLASLVDYLRKEEPDAVFAATPHINVMAVWAKRLSVVDSRLILGERIQIVHYLEERRGWRYRHLLPLIGATYVHADAIIAVSNGVAEELASAAGLDRESVRTVYNPVVVDALLEKMRMPVDHPWFQEGQPPVILSVGRLSDQKDYPTLIKAFAEVRKSRPARLIILGEAGKLKKTSKRQADLMELARQLGVADDVELPGFMENPYAFMAGAALFVMSSTYEGLPTVLIEAMACGCPVVSTAIPGAIEILEDGRWGALAPVGDADGLARAMNATLDRDIDTDALRRRADDFSGERAVLTYEGLARG